jgi:hypothetical protein
VSGADASTYTLRKSARKRGPRSTFGVMPAASAWLRVNGWLGSTAGPESMESTLPRIRTARRPSSTGGHAISDDPVTGPAYSE